MERHWLLTSTFYGTWLPGDERGFVGSVRDVRPGEPDSAIRFEHDMPGMAYDEDMRGLQSTSAKLLKCPPIYLELAHATVLLRQFQETAKFRQWHLHAVSIMRNHLHLVVGVPDDPNAIKILGDFKSYGSRALTREFGKPASETWWTYDGSKRKLPNEKALADAIHYVLHKQYRPLLTWPS